MIHLFANSYSAVSPMFGVGFGTLVFGAILLFIWAIISVILKGYALWHAAKKKEKAWFIIMLIINTMGILELIYLIFVVKKWSKKDTSTPQTPPPAPNVQ